MTSPTAAQLVQRARCLLLDFDGPICSVFAGYPAPQVAAEMRATLMTEGHPLGELGQTTDDPMALLLDAEMQSTTGGRRAEALLEAAEHQCVTMAEPTPGAHDLIRRAAAAGKTVLIVSNNSASPIRTYLSAHGLADAVAEVIGRDPTDARLMKPNPHLLDLAFQGKPFAKEEAIFVGDSISDVLAGRSAGVAVIGFANKPSKARALDDAGPIAVISHMGQLLSPSAK